MKKGFFITLDGSDGCGKSTQAVLLAKRLKELNFDIVCTREPGGTKVAETVRKILLHPKSRISPIAELLLYEACRAQLTDELILPAINSGKVVICERYSDATIAYQGFGRGLDRNIIFKLNNIATAGLEPDLTILLDISVEKGLDRAFARGKDRLENEDFVFHKKVGMGYKWLAGKFPNRIKVVKPNGTIEEISERIFNIVAKQMKITKNKL
ncbi:MAG TPA: dTMP kinase [Elusimicrobia bacterium]|nr:MAG: dTMP kinase [Elusimicrobia bacterium RIFOXYD2_FULL_34_30]HAM39577.1 dTMP kinase [Elusimicrobiota bacterium]